MGEPAETRAMVTVLLRRRQTRREMTKRKPTTGRRTCLTKAQLFCRRERGKKGGRERVHEYATSRRRSFVPPFRPALPALRPGSSMPFSMSSSVPSVPSSPSSSSSSPSSPSSLSSASSSCFRSVLLPSFFQACPRICRKRLLTC